MNFRNILVGIFILIPWQVWGYQKKISIEPFHNMAGWNKDFHAGELISNLLGKALQKKVSFKVVKSKMRLEPLMNGNDEMMDSKNFMEPDMKTEPSVALPESQFTVKGDIVAFSSGMNSEESETDISSKLVHDKAHVEIELKIIRSGTGSILASKRFKSISSRGNNPFSVELGNYDLDESIMQKSKMGHALKVLIHKSANFINDTLKQIPFEGMVIWVDEKNEEVIVNVGEQQGIKFKDLFRVFSRKPGFVDPLTYESLGDKETSVGVLKVKSVLDHYSLAQIVAGDGFEKTQLIRPYKRHRRNAKNQISSTNWWQFKTPLFKNPLNRTPGWK